MNRYKRTLYVGNLDQRVTIDVLKNIFIPFGDIVDVNLPLEQKSEAALAEFQELQIRWQQEAIKRHQRELQKKAMEETDEDEIMQQQAGIFTPMADFDEPLSHKGYAFVEFELPEDAAAAMDNMNRSELYGRVISVNYSTPKNFMKENVDKPVWDHYEGEDVEENPEAAPTNTNSDEVNEPATKKAK
jgi:RNA recognition motif-containing protein